MRQKKSRGKKLLYGAAVLLAAGFLSAAAGGRKAQAYEVSGFYQYETNNTGVTVTKYTGGELTVAIPAKIAGKNVTEIGRDAFSNNDFIEYVNIPDTVTTIGAGAFNDCDSLLEIKIPNNVTTVYSERYRSVFGDCDNLVKATIGNGLTELQESSFTNCAKLKEITIGKNVKNIGREAFQNCKNLTSIVIPSSVKGIERGAFANCGSLKTLKLSEGLEYIGQTAFSNCGSLEEVIIPNSVTAIYSGRYESTFGGCGNLVKVTIGDGLKELQERSFENCAKLKDITIGKNLRIIGREVFQNCGSLTNIVIPSSVKGIERGAFINCGSLKTLKLSEGLEYIGEAAFSNCGSLEEVIIPNSVTAIYSGRYESTFGNCGNLKKLLIPNSVSSIGERVIYESVNAVIYGYADSAAAQYAMDNNLPFQELPAKFSEAITLKEKELLLMVGEVRALAYTVTPADTTDAIVWKTTDEKIAAVDNVGIVTARSIGSVSIIAATTSGKRASITIIVQAAPRTLTFKTASKTIALDQTYTQTAAIDDGSRTDVKVTYLSSNPEIASVSTSGKVTPKKAGTVTITASTFNGLSAVYQLTVKKTPASVTLTPSKITLKVKETHTLKAALPSGSYTSKYTYVSSNTKIVTVDSKGKITARKKGTATITVTTHNGKKATCTVTVK
jgi:uncharacterized protein YjdB/deoxycytidine triphosphate deaminase